MKGMTLSIHRCLGTVSLVPALWLLIQDPPVAASTSQRLTVADVNAAFEKAWADAGVHVASPADDAEWLRRASIVLNGTVPKADEVQSFLKDHSQDKRSKKIDELIGRKEFGENFGGEWTRMLVERNQRGQRFDRNAFSEWVIESFNKNTPFNEFTKTVLTATGRSEDNPAVGYVERWEANAKDLAGQTAKVFLGVQIQCARCHDHKDQQWKQHEFNDFAAYFSNTRVKRIQGADGKPQGEVVDDPEIRRNRAVERLAKNRMEDRAKKAKNPEQAQKIMEQVELKFTIPSPLRPLEEGPLAVAAPVAPGSGGDEDTRVELTRRERLAEWMTRKGNPYYARSIVNTTFSQLFGYGLVNPVDNFRSDSTIAIPALLDALATDFENSHYDFKNLVSLLVKSKAFSLGSAVNAKEKDQERDDVEKRFARFAMRPMSPEQLFDSIVVATGVDEAAEQRVKTLRGKGKTAKQERAMEKMGEQLAQGYGKLRNLALRKFINTFEDDESDEEIQFEGTIPQALLMMNSKLITEAIGRGYTLQKLVNSTSGDAIDWIYLSVLSRKPTGEERNKMSSYISKNGEKKETFEDLIWTLVNCAEFSTIH
jgi:hypothetical protein